MRHAGKELLRAAKASANGERAAVSVPVGRPPVGRLRPVATRPEEISPEDVRLLTEWRNRFAGAFLDEFEATEERTRRWLTETVGPDDSRILFMVEDGDGRTVGHIGLAFIDWDTGYGEADSVLRGADATAGLLTAALRSMWEWGGATLGLSRLGVRVRSDNSAIAFYEKAGFRELRRVPLRREERDDGCRLVEDPSLADGELTLVYMELGEDGG